MNKQLLTYAILIYLGIALIVQLNLTIETLLVVLIPLLLMGIGVYLHQTLVSMIGCTSWFLLALPQLMIATMDNLFVITLEIIVLLVPTLFLLSLLSHTHNQITSDIIRKKPVILTIVIFLLFLSVFYIASTLIGQSLILDEDNTSLQILFLGGLTLVFMTPVFLWNPKRNNMIREKIIKK